MRVQARVPWVLLVLALTPGAVFARNSETPTRAVGLIVEPYGFHFDSKIGDAAKTALEHQHYSVTRLTTDKAGTADKAPVVTMLNLLEALDELNPGVLVIDTHGSTTGFSVEVYEKTAAGKAQRDRVFDDLRTNYDLNGLIDKSTTADGYDITLTSAGIKAKFTDANSIVHNASCSGHGYAAAWGARVVVDYNVCIGHSDAVWDAQRFWEGLDGVSIDYERSVKQAAQSKMKLTGNGDTTLSPAVSFIFSRVREKRLESYEPQAWGTTPGYVRFDTKMDKTVAATQVISATGGATLANVVWDPDVDNGLKFDVTYDANQASATFTVKATKAVSLKNTSVQLDGNTDPAGGLSGKGPNQDDFTWKLTNPTPPCTDETECDDENPCTDDSCSSVGGAFVCSHVPNTASCDDANPCTVDDACQNGACAGAESCHFACYETSKQPSPRVPVDIADQFQSAQVLLEGPLDLCTPVDVSGESPGAPSAPAHLVAYKTVRAGPFVRVPNLTVSNEFGTIVVDVIRPSQLMVPSSKSLGGTPPPLPSQPGQVIDHFECYAAKRSLGAAPFRRIENVALVDQFGSATVTVLKPRLLCAPVDKNGESPGAHDHPIHLMCYSVKSAAPVNMSRTPIFINNQFGPQTVAIEHRELLCVPSLKNSGSPSGAFLDEPVDVP